MQEVARVSGAASCTLYDPNSIPMFADLFYKWFYLRDNCVETTRHLLKALGVRVTDRAVYQAVLGHPDHPAVLSITDALAAWKVDALCIKTKKERLAALPVPFIAAVRQDGLPGFVVVRAVSSSGIEFFNPVTRRVETNSLTDFSVIWDDCVVMAEPQDGAGEINYAVNRRKELWGRWLLRMAALLTVLMVLALFVTTRTEYGVNNLVYSLAVLLLQLSGTGLATALLWYEFDHKNNLLKAICSISKNTDCNIVLQSDGARIGNWLRWSDIGFVYFAGGLLALLMSAFHPLMVDLLLFLAVLSVPFIGYSLWYQKVVVKKWCPLCLGVLVILGTSVVLFLSKGQMRNPMADFAGVRMVSILTMAGLLVTGILVLIRLLEQHYHERNRYVLSHNKIINDPGIFSSILHSQPAIGPVPAELGIVLGNPAATHRIVQVCNPYCGPCASAHDQLETILQENDDIAVQIVFTSSDSPRDMRRLPTAYFMALARKEDPLLLRHALHEWYKSGNNLDTLRKKYPTGASLMEENAAIREMHQWCRQSAIVATPTTFIDGYQLPPAFTIADTKYFLLSK